jgi:GNAT superfamily N-acetyltransferase
MTQSSEPEEPPYLIADLPADVDRKAFTCGTESLDAYFHSIVTQDIKKGYCAAFVAIDTRDHSIAGYYTLCASSVSLDEVPEEQRKKLRLYKKVPCTLMGRLAVATAHQGEKLGSALLYDAWARAANAQIGGVALVVDALHEKARQFYLKHGFLDLGQELQLWHPLKGIPPAPKITPAAAKQSR